MDWDEVLGSTGLLVRNIISDADKIDGLGIIGLQRCQRYTKNCYQNISQLDLIKKVHEHANEKLLRLKTEFIKTEYGKQLAAPLHDEMILELNKMFETTVDHIYQFADALNIEAGFPYKDLISVNPNGIWVNAVIVLDRPIIDNILFDDVLKKVEVNNFELLENAIDDLNEKYMFAHFLLIAVYYIELMPKSHIVIHFHQDIFFKKIISLFDGMLKNILQQINIEYDMVHLEYKMDTPIYPTTTEKYKPDIDVVLSFSQCAGLNPKYLAGDILVPDTFISFEIDSHTIRADQTYKSKNHLLETMDLMVNKNYNKLICSYVNSHYQSKNILKCFIKWLIIS